MKVPAIGARLLVVLSSWLFLSIAPADAGEIIRKVHGAVYAIPLPPKTCASDDHIVGARYAAALNKAVVINPTNPSPIATFHSCSYLAQVDADPAKTEKITPQYPFGYIATPKKIGELPANYTQSVLNGLLDAELAKGVAERSLGDAEAMVAKLIEEFDVENMAVQETRLLGKISSDEYSHISALLQKLIVDGKEEVASIVYATLLRNRRITFLLPCRQV